MLARRRRSRSRCAGTDGPTIGCRRECAVRAGWVLAALVLATDASRCCPRERRSAGALPIGSCTPTSGVILAVDFGHWGGPVLRACGSTADHRLPAAQPGRLAQHRDAARRTRLRLPHRLLGLPRRDRVPDRRRGRVRPHPAGDGVLVVLARRPRPEHLELQPGRRGELPPRSPAAWSCGRSAATDVGGTTGTPLDRGQQRPGEAARLLRPPHPRDRRLRPPRAAPRRRARPDLRRREPARRPRSARPYRAARPAPARRRPRRRRRSRDRRAAPTVADAAPPTAPVAHEAAGVACAAGGGRPRHPRRSSGSRAWVRRRRSRTP